MTILYLQKILIVLTNVLKISQKLIVVNKNGSNRKDKCAMGVYKEAH